MAGADYNHCSKCGAKTFYDAELPSLYDYEKEFILESGWILYPGCGDIKTLCVSCAKTHEVIIVEKGTT